MKMRKSALVIAVTLLISSSALAAETVVFEGTPLFKGVSTPADSFTEKLQGEQQRSSQLIITKNGNNYFWFSREKKPLRYFKSGDIHYFVRTDHSDFVKITDAPTNLGEGLKSAKFLYMESISDGMKGTINYWGYADKLEL